MTVTELKHSKDFNSSDYDAIVVGKLFFKGEVSFKLSYKMRYAQPKMVDIFQNSLLMLLF